MDNLTHTLFGLGLAKAGLERATPLATAALLISSNLPDVDAVMRLRGSLSNLEHHRGITHSFVGLVVLAAFITLLLAAVDRRFRTRDPFRRPIRPARVFLLAYLGGLGHLFMDFTNSYGVRPLLPFSDRWFYGDLTFVADPWVWLILGSAAVWLTAKTAARAVIWLTIGTGLGLLVALAFRAPLDSSLMAIAPLPIPALWRMIWFTGLAAVVLGATLRWGRAGPKVARYSLVFLALYYGGMWTAKQSALQQARNSLPASGAISVAVWPEPADPFRWQSVAAFRDSLFAGHLTVARPVIDWQELPALDARFAATLRETREGKVFLDFARYVSATSEEGEDGYTVVLRDLRLPMRMNVRFNSDLTVRSTDFHWF